MTANLREAEALLERVEPWRGTEVRYLHPAAEQFHLPDDGSPLVRRLNEYFFGPMDFAVIGHRA